MKLKLADKGYSVANARTDLRGVVLRLERASDTESWLIYIGGPEEHPGDAFQIMNQIISIFRF